MLPYYPLDGVKLQCNESGNVRIMRRVASIKTLFTLTSLFIIMSLLASIIIFRIL